MPTPLAIVQCFLRDHGLQVGDYGYDDGVLVHVGGLTWQLFLEGWGEVCVQGACAEAEGKLRVKAHRAAYAWVASQKRRGFDRAGVLAAEDPDVWLVSWAVFGPLSAKGIASGAHLPSVELRC